MSKPSEFTFHCLRCKSKGIIRFIPAGKTACNNCAMEAQIEKEKTELTDKQKRAYQYLFQNLKMEGYSFARVTDWQVFWERGGPVDIRELCKRAFVVGLNLGRGKTQGKTCGTNSTGETKPSGQTVTSPSSSQK